MTKEKFKGFKRFGKVLLKSSKEYKRHDPVRLAGTLAFWTIFALPPILIIIISIGGFFIGPEDFGDKVYDELNSLIGSQGTQTVRDIVKSYSSMERNVAGTIFGIIIFLMASSTFFVTIQNALNTIWQVKPKPVHNFLKFLQDRLLSFGMIISIGFLFLVSLMIDVAVALVSNHLSEVQPVVINILVRALHFIVTFGLEWLVFASIFKLLPDAKVKWRVVWVGAAVTALLFTVGKYLIGFGLGQSNLGSMYGAAGSVVILLLWVFYSALILFFGGEITKQYAAMIDKRIEPKDHAVLIETREVEQSDSGSSG
ncbi:MAG: YihY/virulence factor BrkB family protein [Bacteroidia bacterium]